MKSPVFWASDKTEKLSISPYKQYTAVFLNAGFVGPINLIGSVLFP
jgi:hypothetical protein